MVGSMFESSTLLLTLVLNTIESKFPNLNFVGELRTSFSSFRIKNSQPTRVTNKRIDYGNEEIAYQTRTRKISKIFSFFISLFIILEGIVISLQYMGVAFRLSCHWHSSVWQFIDYINLLNTRFNGINFLIAVFTIGGINIPILVVVLALVLGKGVRIDSGSTASMAILIVLVFPFLMSFGIFSIPIMKVLLETYDCVTNSDGKSVLRRYRELEGGSPEQLGLFGVAMLTLLLQLISSFVFTYIIHKNGRFDEYGNRIQVKLDSDKIELNESEKTTTEKDKSSSLLKFLGRRKRFKRGVKYTPVALFTLQVLLLSIAMFLPQNEWWPSLVGFLVIAPLIAYLIIKQPYSDTRYNHFSTALLFHNFFTFFRSFLINTQPENIVIKQIASYGMFLSPVFLLLGFLVSWLRSVQINYDESDEFDQVETVSDNQNKRNLKFANIIIDKIIKSKVKGIKIQAIRIRETRKDWVIAHGIFWVEGEAGFKNLGILLSHLSCLTDSKAVYFSKISIKNSNVDIDDLEVIPEMTVKTFGSLFHAGLFRYLTHLEINNFVMYEANFFLIIAILQNNPILEVLDISRIELVSFDTYTEDDEFINQVRERGKTNEKAFRISTEAQNAIWMYLKDNTALRKIIDGSGEESFKSVQPEDRQLIMTCHSI